MKNHCPIIAWLFAHFRETMNNHGNSLLLTIFLKSSHTTIITNIFVPKSTVFRKLLAECSMGFQSCPIRIHPVATLTFLTLLSANKIASILPSTIYQG
jgi:hypothetical protein